MPGRCGFVPGPLPCVVSILCRVYFRARALCRVVSIARGKVSSPGMTAQFLLQHGVGLYRNARYRRLIWCICLVLHREEEGVHGFVQNVYNTMGSNYFLEKTASSCFFPVV